jgi:hypothetical protein
MGVLMRLCVDEAALLFIFSFYVLASFSPHWWIMVTVSRLLVSLLNPIALLLSVA